MVDAVQRWASRLEWTGRDRVLALMDQTNALVTPDRASAQNIHLLDPQPLGADDST